MTEEQRSRRPIFIATLRLRAFWPAALSLIGQRPPREFSLFASRIQPKFAAAPLHQSLTWCTSVSETGMSSVSTTNICRTDNDFDRPLRTEALSIVTQALRARLLSACPSGTKAIGLTPRICCRRISQRRAIQKKRSVSVSCIATARGQKSKL